MNYMIKDILDRFPMVETIKIIPSEKNSVIIPKNEFTKEEAMKNEGLRLLLDLYVEDFDVFEEEAMAEFHIF